MLKDSSLADHPVSDSVQIIPDRSLTKFHILTTKFPEQLGDRALPYTKQPRRDVLGLAETIVFFNSGPDPLVSPESPHRHRRTVLVRGRGGGPAIHPQGVQGNVPVFTVQKPTTHTSKPNSATAKRKRLQKQSVQRCHSAHSTQHTKCHMQRGPRGANSA